MKKINGYFLVFVILCAQSLFSSDDESYNARTEKKHFKELNKKIASAKKGKRFVLVQSADSAQIEQNPNAPGSYILSLQEIKPHIQFYKAQPNKSFGILVMRQYVWYCKLGRNAFLRCKRGALGYLSSDGASLESSSPLVVELNRPKYFKKENKLVYEISTVDDFALTNHEMKNVTLVIDLALN